VLIVFTTKHITVIMCIYPTNVVTSVLVELVWHGVIFYSTNVVVASHQLFCFLVTAQ